MSWQTFPFDGARTWTFSSSDPAIRYELVVTSDQEPEEVDGANVYTLDHRVACTEVEPGCVDGRLVRRVRWSSTVADGTAIHGHGDRGGPIVAFRPPIRVVEDVARTGEVLETRTTSSTWTSTLVGEEACPSPLANAWTCSLVELATDGDEGAPLAGRYWNTRGTGFVAMELTAESARWELVDVACEGDCDGQW